jgi:hypothetical protein
MSQSTASGLNERAMATPFRDRDLVAVQLQHVLEGSGGVEVVLDDARDAPRTHSDPMRAAPTRVRFPPDDGFHAAVKRRAARGRVGQLPIPRPRGGELAALLAGKAGFVGWAVVVPVLVFRSAWPVALFLLGSVTLGVVLSTVFQLAHGVPYRAHPTLRSVMAAHHRHLRALGRRGAEAGGRAHECASSERSSRVVTSCSTVRPPAPSRSDPAPLAARLAGVAHRKEQVHAMTRADGLRPIVEALDREMSRFVAGGNAGADPTALLASWAKLVEFLALGPAPELRECPSCGSIGMRAARSCGFCWTKLAPLPPRASA